eukprot:gene4059-7447_t
MGVANNFSLCNPPPPQQLAIIDSKISGAVKRRGAWSRRANARAAFAPNGAKVASVVVGGQARFIAALITDLNSPLLPARVAIREQLLHALRDPAERTEYVLALRILAPLQLCIAAARHPPGTGRAADPQLDEMTRCGLPRVCGWSPPQLQEAPPAAFID